MADVTGSDAAKFQCLQSLSGSFLSNRALQGNLLLTAAGLIMPFNASAASIGQQTDLDGDGDLDIGSNTPGDPAGYWAGRAAELIGPKSIPQNNWTFPPMVFHDGMGIEYTLVDNLRSS